MGLLTFHWERLSQDVLLHPVLLCVGGTGVLRAPVCCYSLLFIAVINTMANSNLGGKGLLQLTDSSS